MNRPFDHVARDAYVFVEWYDVRNKTHKKDVKLAESRVVDAAANGRGVVPDVERLVAEARRRSPLVVGLVVGPVVHRRSVVPLVPLALLAPVLAVPLRGLRVVGGRVGDARSVEVVDGGLLLGDVVLGLDLARGLLGQGRAGRLLLLLLLLQRLAGVGDLGLDQVDLLLGLRVLLRGLLLGLA